MRLLVLASAVVGCLSASAVDAQANRASRPNVVLIITDDMGAYEYETIHPGAYQIGPNAWRPPHIHYLVRASGYRELITQLYFRGDPHQREDQFIRQSLIIDLREERTTRGTYKTGTFDIILARR